MSQPSFPIRVGLLGLGALSQRSLLPHLALPDAREKISLAAVCDLDAQRAEQTARTYRVPAYYTSLTAMLDQAGLDAALICTPIAAHFNNAMESLRAGKHVYVQKTLATTSQEAFAILDEAQQRRLALVASPLQMLNPARQAARQMIAENAIGSVYWAICATHGRGHEFESARLGEGALANIDPSWYYKAGGGPVLDMTVYALHTLTGLFGAVQRVSAFSGLRVPLRQWKGQTIRAEIDDNSLLLLDFGGGQFALANGSTAVGSRSIPWGHLSIFGADGAMEIYSANSKEPNLASVIELDDGRKFEYKDFGAYLPFIHAQMSDPHVFADLMYFAECVGRGERSYQEAAQACHVIEIIEKGYASARSGQALSIQSTLYE